MEEDRTKNSKIRLSEKNRRIISVVCFVIYVFVLIYFLFFAELMGRSAVREGYSYNLIPFKEIRRFIVYRKALGTWPVLLNLAGNVVAFIPFGLFIIPVSGHKLGVREAVMLTFDVTMGVEIIQLFTKVGSFDVDDLILNTLGGIIGTLIYQLHRWIERKKNDGKT